MKNIFRNVILRDRCIHDTLKILHFKDPLIVLCHKAALNEQLFVKEALFASEIFERVSYSIIAIANNSDVEVVFRKTVGLISTEAIVVVNDTTQGVFQLDLIFVIHRDADGKRGTSISLLAPSTNIRQLTIRILDLSRLAVCAETRSAYFRIEFTVCEHQSFVSCFRPWLPLDLADCFIRVV